VSVDLAARRRGVPLAVPVRPDSDRVPAGWRSLVTGAAGEVRTVQDGGITWFVGVGDRNPADWRAAGGALVRSIQDGGHPSADVELPADVTAAELSDFTVGIRLGGYRFRVTADRANEPKLRSVRLCATGDEPPVELERANHYSAATALARDLANTPSNVKSPAWLADTAARVCAGLPGLTVTVRDEKWLAEERFGGILAVGGGSVTPPRLVELAWRPRGVRARPHLVLVGKGVTFDTGGVSLKQAANMHLMRTDMSGAAAVIAALRAIAALRLPVRVTGLAPCAENHLSGSAYRPGDVVRHFDGHTTEVTNTDAEGRMLLADSLGYAVRRLRPDLLVDVATLTGAMKVSLGLRTGGLFASADDVADRVAAAGAAVGEQWWRMPLLDAHADAVHSEIADVRQCPPGPGGITAALFLREFTAGLPWAHLDIAGPARSDKTYDEVTVGGTGYACRTLVRVAESLTDSAPR
jgi:leucyl aminopeptidase